MKTRIILAALLLTSLGMVSCADDADTLRSDISSETRWYSGEFTVAATEWIKVADRNGLNSYYKADKHISELTYDVLRGGQVNCYLYVADNTQAPLPNVRHYENNNGQMWTRTVDYEFYYGGVTVYVTDSDFAGNTPESMTFRISISR